MKNRNDRNDRNDFPPNHDTLFGYFVGDGTIEDTATQIDAACDILGARRAETTAYRTANNFVCLMMRFHLDSTHRRSDAHRRKIAENLQKRCRQRLAEGRSIYSPTGIRRACTPNDIHLVIEEEAPRRHAHRNAVTMYLQIRSDEDTITRARREEIEPIIDRSGFAIHALQEWRTSTDDNPTTHMRVHVLQKYPHPDGEEEMLLSLTRLEGLLTHADITVVALHADPLFGLLLGENAATGLNDNATPTRFRARSSDGNDDRNHDRDPEADRRDSIDASRDIDTLRPFRVLA